MLVYRSVRRFLDQSLFRAKSSMIITHRNDGSGMATQVFPCRSERFSCQAENDSKIINGSTEMHRNGTKLVAHTRFEQVRKVPALIPC